MNNLPLFLSSSANQPWFFLLIGIDLILRGFALWRSSRKDQKIWFIALLVVNSLGILPLIYLLINRDKAKAASTVKKTTRRSRK